MAVKKKSEPAAKQKATADPCRQLADELRSLRTQFHDITTRHQANLEAKLVSCINFLTAGSSDGWSQATKGKREIANMMEAIKTIKLKPKKGRLKDIRRIDELVEEISAKLGLS